MNNDNIYTWGKVIIYVIISILMASCGGGSDDDNSITPTPTPNPNPPDPEPTITITAKPTSIVMPTVGGEQTFVVTTNAENWEAKSSEGWLTVIKEGNNVKLTADPNVDKNRSATVSCNVIGKNTSASVSVSQNKVTERQSDSLALVDLYNSANGNQWKSKWTLTKNFGEWSGVKVINGRVTEINLPANNMTGTLSVSIGRLTLLEYCDLSGNSLSGNIPTVINNFTQLEYIDLSKNKFSGNTPSMNALSKLIVIDLSSNELTSLPSLNSNLSELEYLAFNNNNISGNLVAGWSVYSNLIYLDLSGNSFNGNIPKEWSSLTKMRAFHLYGNTLTGTIPDYIISFADLKSLGLNHNNLSGTIPVNLGTLGKLEMLYLKQNRLTGEIPSSILSNSHWEDWKNNVITQQDGYGFSNVKSYSKSYFKTEYDTSLSEIYKGKYKR